jgi:hypothetical protein
VEEVKVEVCLLKESRRDAMVSPKGRATTLHFWTAAKRMLQKYAPKKLELECVCARYVRRYSRDQFSIH